jgi:hypothetical protein
MAVTNNLKQQVDLPVFEWLRFAPVATTGLTCLTTPRDGSSRYLYYFGPSNVLYRYDTIGDSWQQLSTGPVTPNALLNVKYVKNQGYRGQVLSATSTTLQIPSTGADPTGYEIEIYSGTGKGQRRTITSVNAEVIHDAGVTTSVDQNIITDTVKKYRFNQWEGYGIRIVFGTGFSQYREILYNSNNALTVFDANYDARNFLMTPFATTAPYATLAQCHFAIVSQTVNLNTAWDITPDSTSKFRILSGGIWMVLGNGSSPFFTFYYYDILSDRYVQKLAPAGIFPAAIGTDFSLAPINNLVGTYFTGSITSLTSQSISDSSLNMTRGDWVGTEIEIISGSGIGQGRRIFANTDNTFTFGRAWDDMPTVGSKYAVTGEEAIYFAGNGRAQMVKYHPERSLWSTGTITDNGIAFNLVLQKTDLMQSHGVTTATRVTGGVTGINTTPTAVGTGYIVGDLLTITTGGTLGRVRVESVGSRGEALTLSLYSAGSGYSVGTGRVTTTVGGGGSGCTVEITSVGVIGAITTTLNHDFTIGDTVTFKGATEAAWNTTYTISGIQSLTVVEVPITAAANAAARYTLSTNLLVDETQNWVPNQFVGKLLGVQSNGLSGTVTWRLIIGNTENTITFMTGTAPTNGNSRYFIQELDSFGKDSQYLAVSESSYGFVNNATNLSLTDTTKNWNPTGWALISALGNSGRALIVSSSGEQFENIITSNTANTLNFGRVVAGGSGGNILDNWNTGGSGSLFTALTSPFTSNCNGICWTGNRFVAVGSGGGNTIAWSYDGFAWTGLAATVHTIPLNIAFNGNKFITVGTGTNTIGYSYDAFSVGSFIGLGATVFSTQGNAVAWNGIRWVAVGQGTNTIAHSLDTGSAPAFTGLGTSIFSTAGRGICWAGNQWVAVGNGTNNYATSSDGITWAGGGAGPFTTQGNAVAWNGNITVAVGQGTNTIAYSTNSGSTWTGIGTSIFSTAGTAIAWNGTYWIAGGSGTNTSAFSLDGINWTGNGSSGITTQINCIASTTPYKSLVPNIGFIPNTGSLYKIYDTYGRTTQTGATTTLTDSTKKWKTNQWAGKRLLFTGGSGVGQETPITSNTGTTLTFTAVTTAPDNTTTYTILGRPALGAGMTLEWNWSGSVAADKGKLLISPRGGGSHTFDIYDLRTNEWKYGLFILGQGDTLTTGTMYAYDGDRIYFQRDSTGRIMYYDYVKNEIRPFATIPYGMGTAILGNRMEIVQTADGLKYLYIMRHTGAEMWRTLIYY